MEHVYQSYFGLTEPPFNITPDPLFLYRSGSHREALAQLSYGIKARKGFVVLTGEVGTGKTTLIHSLLRDLGETSHTALIFSVITNPCDLLRWVCEEFRLVEPKEAGDGIHEYLVLLNDFLLDKYRKGENCALIVDEAQNLSAEVLESIRLLSNFETAKDKLLQIVLVGQPELAARLNSQELRQLKQRIALRHELRPLSLAECQEYVFTRLKLAGGNPAIFTYKALETIHSYSGGIPRLINVLGDNALLTAYALAKKTIEESIIEEVAHDLSLRADGAPRIQRIVPGGHLNGSALRSLKAVPTLASVKNLSNRAIESTVLDDAIPLQRFDALRQSLTEAMGPMASIVLEERIQLMGHTIKAFPEKKWETLIQSVSEEILEPTMRRKFQESLFHRTPVSMEK
jgi:general secretion pathway protein A